MSAIGVQSQINKDRALWLSSIPTDIIHGNILCDTIIANAGYISTFYSDNAQVSTLLASTLTLSDSLDVSTINTSSFFANFGKTSTLQWASDLSGGVGYVEITTDASGVSVDGDPIVFNNLVYFQSTITLVPVSTIVDTDIFAQNGFFSTLSSGSISTSLLNVNQQYVSSLQGNYGTFSSLSVSSLEALDVSGDFAKNWSQYPTLNSSIIFQPAYILSNVSNKLFFAGQELTDASGGGNNWSAFPALQDVSMNNFSLRAISTLQFQDTATLTSLTGNNLQYNGQPVQYGSASNVSQWANYTAVNNVNMNTSSILNAGNIGASNLALSGSNVTNGNTFTGTLSVAGTTLIPLASINNLGQLSCQDIDVSNPAVGLADVNIYGATALPGDNALYVQGGVQFDGGTIHGFSAGVLPVAGINTGRIDMLQAGFNLLHPAVGAITTGGALGITSGGALSLAGGAYVEMNTSTLQMINTSQGNKNTTIQAGFLTIDPDVAPTSSIKLFNTLGGGVEIDGGGQGSLTGFSTIRGSNLSSINLDVSTINGVDWQDISGGVFTTISSFNYVQTSTLKVSTISGTKGDSLVGSTMFLEGGLQFVGGATGFGGQGSRFLSSVRTLNNTGEHLDMSVSTMDLVWNGGINPTGYVRIGEGGAFDSFFKTQNGSVSLSTPQILANSTIAQEVVTSSIGAFGGFPLILNSYTSFATLNTLDNCIQLNTNGPAIPSFTLNASTINLATNNTFTQSLSTIRLSTSAFNFSSATCSLSNTAFNVPLFIDYDTAGNTTTAGCAIRLAGHNLSAGAVRNELWMGFRASDGVNYIQAVWPGQNLEDLNIEGDPVVITDGSLSTIFNTQPYALQTTGGVAIGTGSGLITLSTNHIKVGGQTNLTGTSISTTFLNLPYGNEFYMAGGPRQPHIQFGTQATSGGSGNQQVQIATPYYDSSNYVVQVTMRDTNTAQMSAEPNSISSFTIYWSNGGGGSHAIDWTTFGNLPFTG